MPRQGSRHLAPHRAPTRRSGHGLNKTPAVRGGKAGGDEHRAWQNLANAASAERSGSTPAGLRREDNADPCMGCDGNRTDLRGPPQTCLPHLTMTKASGKL